MNTFQQQQLPNLIIAGVHKAATTSLFMYLKDHPAIYGPGKKELHYFTPLRYGEPLKDINTYKAYFANAGNAQYLLDASPSYFYGTQAIADKMTEILPAEHKVIVVLRNPTSRFFSYLNFLRANLTLKPGVDTQSFIDKCLAHKGLIKDDIYSRAINEGKYIEFIPAWVRHYKANFKIVYFEELIADPLKVMCDLAAWLNISDTPFRKMNFSNENKTVFVSNRGMHSIALNINNKFEKFWRQNHALKKRIRSIYYLLNKGKQHSNQNDKQYIDQINGIYEPYNKELASFLRAEHLPLPSWLAAANNKN